MATRIGASCIAVSAPAASMQVVDFNSPPVSLVLESLFEDKTTKGNIVLTAPSAKPKQLSKAFLKMHPGAVRARVEKAMAEQSERTKKSAEVFTPSWVVNRMNNYLDEDWFGRKNVFNIESGRSWRRQGRKVRFESAGGWKEYVDSRRLEITCGEAPFIVSRYDAATGEIIPVKRRIGILDRKLRVVGENAADEKEWMKWALRAYESVYGYEYQGDSLAIARANLVATYEDYVEDRWGRKATLRELTAIANRVAWNFWQMDGITGECTKWHEFEQMFFNGFSPATNAAPKRLVQTDLLSMPEETKPGNQKRKLEKMPAVIFDWRARAPVVYNNLKRSNGKKVSMKFDYIIGNPPYQEDVFGDNKTYAPPVYHKFMDESYDVGDKVELITPARFLFDAGSTPKEWNRKMLRDPHLKVLWYESDSAKVFAGKDIKGGVAISYRDNGKSFGSIEHFIVFDELRSIASKVASADQASLMSIIYAAETYRFTDKMHEDFPSAEVRLSKGHKYDFKTSVFENLSNIVFFDDKPADGHEYVQILGLEKMKRCKKWIRKDYVNPADNFTAYKVFVPGANGSGALGEVLTTPLIGEPLIGVTQTFISIGKFSNKNEAEACLKYVKSKFARVLLGILKITQHNPGPKWRYVPLQDFTSNSDIDWTKSVKEIDEQLYKKYGLDENEIKFIEEKVRAME